MAARAKGIAMNADLVKTGRVRRSPQGQGTLYPLVTKSEHERIANPKLRPITSIKPLESISYAFSFPLCDLLICEFPEFVPNSEQAKPTRPEHIASRYNSAVSDSVQKVSRFVHYVYQKVVRRKPIPYQPSPKNPSYLLCYVEEELECGHKVTVHPSALETLTARKRNCSECSSWFGGLKLPEGKKPNKSILRSYERIKKQAGESFWPLAFAAGCLLFMAGLVYFNQPHPLIFSPAKNDTTVRILRQYGDYSFQIQRVVGGIPQSPEVRHFDEKPPFEPGMTLTWLEVNDRGKVWSVKHIDPYFRLERDELGWPTLAPNCRQDLEHDHVVCKGVPQF